MSDLMRDRRTQRVALVLWPSFVVGGIGTVCFFSLFDPATLPFSDSLLPFDEGRLGQHRVLVYSAGFFIFWTFAAASSWLTSFLQRTPSEINAAPPDRGARQHRPLTPGPDTDDTQGSRSDAAAAGFAHPLQMLLAGHDRIEAQFGALRDLCTYTKENGCDGHARRVAADVMDYFDNAAQHHHDDEEIELFPRLLRSTGSRDAERAAMLVAWLTGEHREIDAAWQVQRSLLERIVRGENVELSASAIERFAAFYRGHAAVEEQQLLPLAAALLAPAELAAIAAAMAQRRGLAATG